MQILTNPCLFLLNKNALNENLQNTYVIVDDDDNEL